MQDYRNNEDNVEQIEEKEETHFFCKLTFGQFFTLMVLEVITLSFVFYLGARYGNEYLKLDEISGAQREPVSIVSEKPGDADPARQEDAELRAMAREALGGDKVDLKKRVEEILARQQGPTTPPIGEPAPTDDGYEEAPEPPQVEAGEGNAEEVVKVKSTGSAKYSVQVGSYPDVKEASYRVEEWKAKGYPAYMMIVSLGEKGQWYRVRIGAFTDKEEAGNYLNDLAEKEEISDAIVVKNEQ